MKWKPLLLASFMSFSLLPSSYVYSWTATEWLGVVEAVAGTAAIRGPTVPSGDTCDNCGGTGKLGDGTISVECPVCEGTGKKKPRETLRYDQDCRSCGNAGTIGSQPTLPGKEAPTAPHEASKSGGAASHKRGLFRRIR